MKIFKLYKYKTKCWWCGSNDLSREHKIKKTELELLYGKVYGQGNSINHIKYKTETKGESIQSSDSNRVKFEKILCKNCNNTKSQRFDRAYEKLIKFYYFNKFQILISKVIDLEKVFGETWEEDYQDVKRYIGKHVGCRMAENGLFPSENLIDFLNYKNDNTDLKVLFQIKPYPLGDKYRYIDSIFLGPANPINNSEYKVMNYFTSFSGWHTFAKLSWNYLHEEGAIKNVENSKIIKLEIVNYESFEDVNFKPNEENILKDWSNLLDRLEYYPYSGNDKNLEHYKYMKSVKTNN